jgi:hypothetical protein
MSSIYSIVILIIILASIIGGGIILPILIVRKQKKSSRSMSSFDLPSAPENGKPEISQIYCPFCGSLNPAGAVFCMSCGQKMADAFQDTSIDQHPATPEDGMSLIYKKN